MLNPSSHCVVRKSGMGVLCVAYCPPFPRRKTHVRLTVTAARVELAGRASGTRFRGNEEVFKVIVPRIVAAERNGLTNFTARWRLWYFHADSWKSLPLRHSTSFGVKELVTGHPYCSTADTVHSHTAKCAGLA